MKHDEQADSYVICSVCINSPPSLKKINKMLDHQLATIPKS